MNTNFSFETFNEIILSLNPCFEIFNDCFIQPCLVTLVLIRALWFRLLFGGWFFNLLLKVWLGHNFDPFPNFFQTWKLLQVLNLLLVVRNQLSQMRFIIVFQFGWTILWWLKGHWQWRIPMIYLINLILRCNCWRHYSDCIILRLVPLWRPCWLSLIPLRLIVLLFYFHI
jgi:hypothetical protein